MPAGLLSDQGCTRLRDELFGRNAVDAMIAFDNHDAIFPIHRGMKFALVTATRGGSSLDLQYRAGVRRPADLDDVPDDGEVPEALRVPVTLVRRFSGPSLAVPELRSERDRGIVAKVLAGVPELASEAGWHVTFGRELNATDDRPHFGSTGYAVLEGKLLEPFVVHLESAREFVEPALARKLLGARVDRPRLGYREVAAATNRITLIAAIVPERTVTTHTIFCLREAISIDDQWCLCGLLNGYVANYLIRLRGGTHVPAAAMQRLRVPRPVAGTRTFARITAWSKAVSCDPEAARTRERLHAETARAYGIDAEDLRHILSTFPIVPEAERDAVLAAFVDGGVGL